MSQRRKPRRAGLASRSGPVRIRAAGLFAWLCVAALLNVPILRAVETDTLPDGDFIMRALESELQRSMTLKMEDLEQPYFIQFNVNDTLGYQFSSVHGAITGETRNRQRTFENQIRVGDMTLDNTNFAGGFGMFGGFGGALPLDDDPLILRQAIWLAVDHSYKSAVETLTRKRAYLKDKKIDDRPPDFTPAEPLRETLMSAPFAFEPARWRQLVKDLSARFRTHSQLQDSGVRLSVSASKSYLINSEGARVQTADSGIFLTLRAERQAEDGMRLGDSRLYMGEQFSDLPPIETIQKELEEMVADLDKLAAAPILESYTGPVLFDGYAAAQVVNERLAAGFAATPEPVGQQRRANTGPEGLEKKLGQAILPKSFRVYDDPLQKRLGERLLVGNYQIDAEGVRAQRVDIVVDGVLKNLLVGRVPTRKASGSNGHARSTFGGASISNLFIEAADGKPEAELMQALRDLAKESGLEFAVRVKALRGGGSRGGRRGGLPDPLYAVKVFVEDGREELFRGAEFGEINDRTIRKIAAAGNAPALYNVTGGGFGRGPAAPASIIAPAMLFEELELSKIQQEFDQLPIMPSPIERAAPRGY